MRVNEQVQAPVPVAQAWDFLWQTERLAACLPGCTGVQELEAGQRYKVQFEDRIGPYRVHFDLDISVQETQPRRFVRLLSTGQDKLLGTSQKVTLDVTLQETSPDRTTLDIAADVLVLGKIATLGQFVLKRKVTEVVRQFARNIQAELQPPVTGGTHA